MTTIRTIARVTCASLVVFAATSNLPAAPGAADLSGTWQLNRSQSQFPKEVAFGPQFQGDQSDPESRGGGGGRGGRGGGGGGLLPNSSARPPSREDVEKTDQLMDEIKNPPATLTISQTEESVTIADGEGLSRIFRTNAKQQVQQFKAGPMLTISTWTAGKLVVEYQIEKDRKVRYSYARSTGPTAQPQLQVEVQLLEKGKGTPIKRVYDPVSRTP